MTLSNLGAQKQRNCKIALQMQNTPVLDVANRPGKSPIASMTFCCIYSTSQEEVRLEGMTAAATLPKCANHLRMRTFIRLQSNAIGVDTCCEVGWFVQ